MERDVKCFRIKNILQSHNIFLKISIIIIFNRDKKFACDLWKGVKRGVDKFFIKKMITQLIND